MKVGDLVKPKGLHLRRTRFDDGFGFITQIKFCTDRGYKIIFVNFPTTGWAQWFHPKKLEVISENR